MIHLQGNAVSAVLDGDVDVLAHCCNCQNNFGSGIAREVRLRIPEAYYMDTDIHKVYDDVLGKYSMALLSNPGVTDRTPKYRCVLNVYGQRNYGEGKHLNYAAFTKGMIDGLLSILLSLKPKEQLKVAVPYLIGCDRAGGDWNVMREILADVESYLNVEFYVYELPKPV